MVVHTVRKIIIFTISQRVCVCVCVIMVCVSEPVTGMRALCFYSMNKRKGECISSPATACCIVKGGRELRGVKEEMLLVRTLGWSENI